MAEQNAEQHRRSAGEMEASENSGSVNLQHFAFCAFDGRKGELRYRKNEHVMERGRPHESCHNISKLTGNIVQLSQHKYASNVVEKCLEYGDSAERELIGKSAESVTLLVKALFSNP